MFGSMPALWGSGAVPAPDTIFGGDLDAWFRADSGITTASGTGVDRVINWVDTVDGSRNLNGADAVARPRYIALDVDGTPSVFSDKGDSTGVLLDFGGTALPIRVSGQTLYAFVAPGSDASNKTLLKTAFHNIWIAIHAGAVPVKYPGMYNFAWFAPVQADVTTWSVIRWNIVNGAADVSVDTRGELAFAPAWLSAGSWGQFGAAATLGSGGTFKEWFAVNDIIDDANLKNTEVLDYFAAKYPTLVTY